MLRCENLALAVPGRMLCSALSARFESGQLWTVLGRNGTGKSTLIHTLAGLAQPRSGAIELDGVPLQSIDARERARKLGVLLQIEEGSYWGTVGEYVLLGRFPHAHRWSGYEEDDRRAAQEALEVVHMSGFAAQSYATLSGGERQRVRIAQILAQAPRTYLLDEPLQHLDLAHQAEVIALMRLRAQQHGEAVVMVLHEPLWIGTACTHALILSGDGTVEAGPAEALLTRERLERAYGCKLREVARGEGRCFVPDV